MKRTKKGESIFVVNQGRNESDNLWLCYYVDGRIINRGEVSVSLKMKNLHEKNKSTQHFIKKIRNFDYLYIKNIDDRFIRDYYALFNDKNDMKNGRLFLIDKNVDGAISLKKLN